MFTSQIGFCHIMNGIMPYTFVLTPSQLLDLHACHTKQGECFFIGDSKVKGWLMYLQLLAGRLMYLQLHVYPSQCGYDRVRSLRGEGIPTCMEAHCYGCIPCHVVLSVYLSPTHLQSWYTAFTCVNPLS